MKLEHSVCELNEIVRISAFIIIINFDVPRYEQCIEIGRKLT